MEQYEEEAKPVPVIKRETIKDMVSLYVECRQGMANAVDDYDYYMKMRESIRLGCSLLPPDSLTRKAAREVLRDERSYLPKRNMDWRKSESVYAITTGSSTIGNVNVRPEEIKNGERWIINQQAAIIVRYIESTDDDIFDVLVAKGIVPIESPGNIILRELKEAWRTQHGI